MRIAQLGNLYQPVPAIEYGGTQRTIAQIAAFQAACFGHDITVYAPADSDIINFTRKIADDYGLLSCVDKNTISVTNNDGRVGYVRLVHAGFGAIGYNDLNEQNKHQLLFAQLVKDDRDIAFDIIHNHHRWFMNSAIIPAGLQYKTITHQHHIHLEDTYTKSKYPLICISESQACLMQQKNDANVLAVIHHGLDQGMYRATTEHGGYLAWVGRFLHEKGAERAIKIAAKANMPLLIAGTVYDKKPESRQYFEDYILPYITIDDPGFLNSIALLSVEEIKEKIKALGQAKGVENPVIFCGPANEAQKQALFGGAMATLFPISWPEPFGLVMIESMACGTPVIAYESIGNIHCGAVGEVVEEGVTGFRINAQNESDGIEQAAKAVVPVSALSRKLVRDTFDRNWISEKTAELINTAYEAVLFKNNNPLILH